MGINLRACAAEFMAMCIFVFICAGTATGVGGLGAPNPAWVFMVALTFGFCITCLAYSIGHHSGGHINCAVTFGLVLEGAVPLMQGLANFGAQMLGSVVGAALIALTKKSINDSTGGLGSNMFQTKDTIPATAPAYMQQQVFEAWQVLFAEMFCTFLLMYTVLETAVNKQTEGNRLMAAVAIGFSVFLAHCFMIPVDGCSINPTRSFGPALVAKIRHGGDLPDEIWGQMWVFWLGPLLGAAMAVGWYKVMKMVPGEEKTSGQAGVETKTEMA